MFGEVRPNDRAKKLMALAISFGGERLFVKDFAMRKNMSGSGGKSAPKKKKVKVGESLALSQWHEVWTAGGDRIVLGPLRPANPEAVRRMAAQLNYTGQADAVINMIRGNRDSFAVVHRLAADLLQFSALDSELGMHSVALILSVEAIMRLAGVH